MHQSRCERIFNPTEGQITHKGFENSPARAASICRSVARSARAVRARCKRRGSFGVSTARCVYRKRESFSEAEYTRCLPIDRSVAVSAMNDETRGEIW